MLYHMHDLQHAALAPVRAVTEMMRAAMSNPFNPLHYTPIGKNIAASTEVFERTTRRFGKPEFGLHTTDINGKSVKITEEMPNFRRRKGAPRRHFDGDRPRRRRNSEGGRRFEGKRQRRFDSHSGQPRQNNGKNIHESNFKPYFREN